VDLPRDVAVTRKRPTWLRDTLQDAVRGMQLPVILSGRENDLRVLSYMTESHHEEEQVAPPVVRQMAPPSTSSEGARVQRESTLRIQ
jgi:hypothetical protein